MRRYLTAMEARPDEMEAITLDPTCPVGNSPKYREAGRRVGREWICIKMLGSQYCGDWPSADLAVLKVWNCIISLHGHSFI